MKEKNFVLYDVIFYLVFPLAVWHLMRDAAGDYYAISSLPDILYTGYRFYTLKKVNVFGIYMITILVVGTLVDLLSGSAIRSLWNNVIYAYILGGFFMMTILVRFRFTLPWASVKCRSLTERSPNAFSTIRDSSDFLMESPSYLLYRTSFWLVSSSMEWRHLMKD